MNEGELDKGGEHKENAEGNPDLDVSRDSDLVVQDTKPDSVEDEKEEDGQAEGETGDELALTVTVDPEPDPGEDDEQEGHAVDLCREEVHVCSEGKGQLLARIRP